MFRKKPAVPEPRESGTLTGRLSVQRSALAVWFLTGILCFLPVLVMNDLFGYFVPAFFLFASLLSAGICRWQSGKIRLSFEGGENVCRRKERMSFSVLLENHSRIPCSRCSVSLRMEAEDGSSLSGNQALFTLGSGERRTFQFEAVFDHLGVYRVVVEEVCVHSLIGVLSFRVDFQSRTDAVTVCPRFYIMEESMLSEQVYTDSQQAKIKSEAESIDSAGVREYAYGDPIKLIHWKLSSHSGNYVTRVLESYGKHALTVIPCCWIRPETVELRMDLRDSVIESCASLCRQAGEDGMETRIRFAGRGGLTAEYLPEREEDFSTLLGEMQPFSTDPEARAAVQDLLEKEAASLYSSDNIAVCTAALNEVMTEVLIRMTAGGRNVVLFFCTSGQAESSVESQIRELETCGVLCIVFQEPESLGRAVGQ